MGIRLKTFYEGQKQLKNLYNLRADMVNFPWQYHDSSNFKSYSNIKSYWKYHLDWIVKLGLYYRDPGSGLPWTRQKMFGAIGETEYELKRFGPPLQAAMLEQRLKLIKLFTHSLYTKKCHCKRYMKNAKNLNEFIAKDCYTEEGLCSGLPHFRFSYDFSNQYNNGIDISYSEITLLELPVEEKMHIKVVYKNINYDDKQPFIPLGIMQQQNSDYILLDTVKPKGVDKLKIPLPWDPASVVSTVLDGCKGINYSGLRYIIADLIND
ncbi:hypothetical protein P0136_11430 [Lentisphaerota bacterium ZTH]|nr:hypothetical protein JYG24_11050 [Lentisphaerota bacterium]WET05969.1 hypothetical protein P0136_11430 [Lentisphaerota bacterium ZTH]